MFEHILALFGKRNYGVKLAGENSRKTGSNARRAVFDSIEEQIRRPLGEPSYNPPETREQFWIMCDIISEDLHYIFGDDWRTKLNFPLLHNYKSICEKNDVVRNMFIHPTQIAYQVWLSKKGRYDFAFYQGYHRHAYNGENNTENQDFATRICKVIEKNMQAAHPTLPLRLVVVPDKPWLVRWEHCYTAVDIHGLEKPW